MTDSREHPPPATAPAAPEARALEATGPSRVVGLDGIRGLAALFVVLNHIFERAWPGYPANPAPFWAAWLSYGRFSVVMFIALSGFSRWAVPNGKSVVVYGLLVQDVFSVGSPNRAFWSIAIEAQLYVLLPLLLLLVRRLSARAMVGLVAAIVVTIGLLGPHVPLMNSALIKFIPDLAVLFAVGLLASGIVTAGERTRSRPWAGYALAATMPVIALMVVKGSTWSNLNLFWLDLASAPAVGCFLAAIATSRPRPVISFLDGRLPRSLGACSYSLYLTHMPIVIAVSYGLVLGRVTSGTPMFFALAAILLPVTVSFARLFAAVFELPFQRHRGWVPLRQAMSARLWQRHTGPAVVAGRSRNASQASGPRNQAGGRCRPVRQQLVADGARPASRQGPLVPPGPGDCATRSGSC